MTIALGTRNIWGAVSWPHPLLLQPNKAILNQISKINQDCYLVLVQKIRLIISNNHSQK